MIMRLFSCFSSLLWVGIILMERGEGGGAVHGLDPSPDFPRTPLEPPRTQQSVAKILSGGRREGAGGRKELEQTEKKKERWEESVHPSSRQPRISLLTGRVVFVKVVLSKSDICQPPAPNYWPFPLKEKPSLSGKISSPP